ncbi:hypothetical protein [Propionivibrio sp.]|uniref:hypothetical protein n=1 Tax=Propionivibrio sp. TaxID=2212460 RepID=UPI00262AD6EA|nr:hypothetical protein [Propionivibrio sp.]
MQTNTPLQHRPFDYRPTSLHPFYRIAPEVGLDEVHDYLNARLGQLFALLATTYGEGGESFRACNDDIQDDYLWSCATLADECRALFGQFPYPATAKPDGGKLASVFEQLNQLHRNGVLIINPQAVKHEVDDAQGFLDWAGQQAKGGAA